MTLPGVRSLPAGLTLGESLSQDYIKRIPQVVVNETPAAGCCPLWADEHRKQARQQIQKLLGEMRGNHRPCLKGASKPSIEASSALPTRPLLPATCLRPLLAVMTKSKENANDPRMSLKSECQITYQSALARRRAN